MELPMSNIAFYFLVLLTPFIFYWDIKYFRIPDLISIGGWILIIFAMLIFRRSDVINFLIGSGCSFILLLIVEKMLPGKLGFGDIKLSLITGGVSGAYYWNYSLLISTTLGIIAFLILKTINKKSPSPIPFGPFLCTGSLILFFLTGILHI
jgi:leader peptidase (prepilin peptidase) / N-methyltransferase